MTTDRTDEPPTTGGQSGGDVVDCITSSAVTAEEAVDALCAVAASDPERIDEVVTDATGLVADGRQGTSLDDRMAAATVLADFAGRRREYASDVATALASALDDPSIETTALRALARVTTEEPTAVDPILEAVGGRLTDEPLPTRQSAARVLEARADDDPTAVSGLVPQLVEAVVRRDGLDVDDPALPDHERSRLYDQEIAERRFRRLTAAVLDAITAADPETVAPELDRLGTVIDPENARNATLEEQVVSIVRSVAAESPERALDAAEPLLAVVESGSAPAALRADAAGTIATLADTHFEAATESAHTAIPALGDLVTNEDPAVRANAGTFLSYLAQRYPEAVASLTDTLVERLNDEQVPIRASMVWTLGYLDTDASRDALRETSVTDSDPDVRALAEERLQPPE